MRTNLLRLQGKGSRGWREDRFRKFVIISLLVSITGKLTKPGYPFAFLKGLLGVCREGSMENLGKLGLFMIPSPNGDTHEGPYEVGVKSHWYPFKPIPNVRHFEIELKAFDPIFAMFGIKKRFSPTIKFEKYENHRYNRYMESQLRRLEKVRVGQLRIPSDYSSYEEFLSSTYERRYQTQNKHGVTGRFSKPNPDLYFKIVTILLKHSRVFFVRQMMLTEPRGHREIPYRKVIKGWHSHRKIANEASGFYYKTSSTGNKIPRLQYRRVFIPKSNGKGRPLGVPSYPGRIYLAQWNKFLLKGLEGKLDPHQHAYQPNKSVHTVGKDIMENIINKRNIYSGDLTKYFDKVDLESACKSLEELGVPKLICECLGRMHHSLPTNLQELGLFGKSKVTASEHMLPENSLKEMTGYRMYPGTSEMPNFGKGVGIPQGGSVSPLLAIVLQESKYFPNLKAQGATYVQYSDDVIAASNNDRGIPDLTVSSQGIYESKEKSFGVKREGVGLKPLDFCGLRYDGVVNRIIANTRSGSRLELKDVDGLVPLLAFRDLIPGELNQKDNSFKDLPSGAGLGSQRNFSDPKQIIKHQAGGLLQSRLFSGSGELEDYKQDFRLTARKSSLVSMHYKHLRLVGVNVFTSTSGAFPIVVDDLKESRRKYNQRGRLRSIKKKQLTTDVCVDNLFNS